jgi:hypothetical protein
MANKAWSPLWRYRRFAKEAEARAWAAANRDRYETELLFVQNGFEVAYRKLRRVY